MHAQRKIYWNFYHGIVHIVREGRRIRIILSDNMHVRGKIYWYFYHGIVHIVREGRRIRIQTYQHSVLFTISLMGSQ
jgi:hypothetical protein